MGLHFAGLMYNARTDTLFTKPTFSRLTNEGKSCVVVLDGYFEWKASPLAGGKGKKQPYFVSRKLGEPLETTKDSSKGKHLPYLLMPGLWTRVATGHCDEPFLDTFTILTTEACKQIEWLHHRMPVCIWDLELAMKWLQHPSPEVHKQIDLAAKSNNDGFAWHMVTTEMSSVKFRGKEAIAPKKGPKPVSAFFGKTDNKSSPQRNSKPYESSSPAKRDFLPSPDPESSGRSGSTPSKKAKSGQAESPKEKGLITSFFQKKG